MAVDLRAKKGVEKGRKKRKKDSLIVSDLLKNWSYFEKNSRGRRIFPFKGRELEEERQSAGVGE